MYSNIDYRNLQAEKVAMYGGSFNPIHNGHTQLVRYFIDELDLDRIFIIPDGTPPHKSNTAMVSALHRYNMCRLATEYMDKTEVSDIEIRREGKSYTVDTLRVLQEMFPKARLFLIMGEDMFLSLHTWKDYREIFRLAIICALPREHNNISPIMNYAKAHENEGLQFIVSDKKVAEISSTEIRNCVREGIPIKDKVNKRVAEYITKNSLYRGDIEVGY